MLTRYIKAAMKRAMVERLEDDGSFYGEIPSFEGVWATGDSPEACRAELREVLEGWILLRLSKGRPLPCIDGIDLAVTLVG